MPKITIDDKTIEVEPGTMVIEAARRLGIDVPHFCYHPKLTIAGNCRMCLVEVEKFPKPQISCNLVATEGMVVKTQSENAKKWRKNVLEFILVNHPIDCPVCDQAGECKLQNYYLSESVKGNQFEEEKVHKPKRVPLGPQVMLDDERCIMCSRCIRFCDEISKTSELGFIQRGDHVELRPFPGKQLDNKYSMNTVDICPVGALTSEDFRFKQRVWFLKSTPSICAGCSRGCNIKLQWNKDTVYRYLPRENDAVNQCWLCDAGRLSYKEINAANRLLHSEQNNGESLAIVTPEAIVKEIAEDLKTIGAEGVVAVGNAQASNENNYALKKFATLLNPKAELVYSRREVPHPDEDDLLIKADKNPNTRGVSGLGFSPVKGRLSPNVLFILGELSEADRQKLLDQEPTLTVALASHRSETTALADYILPVTTHAEEEGSFTNFEGRVQKFEKGLPLRGDMRPAWAWLKEIANRFGLKWEVSSAEGFLKEGLGLTYAELGDKGKAT
ncbi:MAG: 2Fe-2S iron-sulfur cluster-binding protein [bacterium]